MTTWMLVEDDPDLHEMLVHMIEGIGHQVLAFMDGEDAVEWIDSLAADPADVDRLPELALIDIRLPGDVGGPDVAIRLRQSAPLKQMAIVLMTAYRLSALEETRIMQTAAPDMMLYKPLPTFPVFRRKLEDLLM